MKNCIAILLLICQSTFAGELHLKKGMTKAQLLELMGIPVSVASSYLTYPRSDGVFEHRQMMFSNKKCDRGETSVCSVTINEEGNVISWLDVKPAFTEDGR